MTIEPPLIPPPHNFDEDALIDDFVDDEDFASHHAAYDDEAYLNEMMMLNHEEEQQQQQQQQQQQPHQNEGIAGSSHGSGAIDELNGSNDPYSEEDENMKDSTGTATSAHVNNNRSNNNIQLNSDVPEEYRSPRLASDDEKLFSFERYKQNVDWRRTPLSPNSANAAYRGQASSSKHSRHYESLLLASRSRVKAAAADSQLLELLRWREIHINHSCGGRSSKIHLNRSSKSTKNRSDADVLQFPQEGVDTVPMTLRDGTRVYVRCRPADLGCSGTKDTTTQSTPVGPPSSSSLGVNMKELKCRVDAITRRSLAAKEKFNVGATRGTRFAMMTQEDCDLWVDKHAPASFPHLLSDERTNREVLRALRGWDPYVFGREPPSRPSSHVLHNQQEQQQGQVQNKPNKGDKGSKNDRYLLDKRPEESQRVILLSGPPGVGKTTLAHIVARHAGYRPMEVNASDDRSASVLGDCIRRAMESTAITFQPATLGKLPSNRKNTQKDYGKPNCLILDEIDGADAKGAIQALVEIVRAEIPPKTAKQKHPYMRRPIICICNHKYAPALRPLLPYAVHFTVDPPSSARLVARLKAILNHERLAMMAGESLLHQLVVSTGGDIRSCLFTLQFAAAQAEDSIDLSNALGTSLRGSGLKDDRNDMASTITAIFRKDKFSSNGKAFGTIGASASGVASSVSRVIDCVESLSDDSAAANALFMNVLRVSYIDPAFDRCSAAHELLSAADFRGDGSTEFYSMQKICTPAMAAAIHLLCRVEMKPSLTLSARELADIQYRKEANEGLVQKFCEVLPAKAKNLKCGTVLTEEFIPLALWVLSAGEGSSSLRRAASSIDILSRMERDTANAHVAALCSLGLTYVPDNEFHHVNHNTAFRAGNPYVEMRLEPPIHRLVQYNSVGARGWSRRREIPSAMKELLAHQVRLKGFLNREGSVNSKEESKTISTALEVENSPSSSPGKGVVTSSNDTLSTPTGPLKATPRKLEEIAASATIPEPKRMKTTPSPTAGNFLGIAAKKGKEARSARRAAAVGLDRSSSLKHRMAHTGSGFQLNHVIRMKYVKGFTQAVRTPCRLQDLE